MGYQDPRELPNLAASTALPIAVALLTGGASETTPDMGAIFLSREPAGSSEDFNRVAGVDANFRFFKSFSINSFAARSDTPGVRTNQDAGKIALGWEDSLKRFGASIMKIGEGFKDDMGFVRRTGVTRQFYDVAFLPQPERLRKHGIRQLQPHARAFI